MAEKKPELDEMVKRAERDILRALAPMDPDARMRVFAAILVMQSTELAKLTVRTFIEAGGFRLDATGIDTSISISYDKEGGTDG